MGPIRFLTSKCNWVTPAQVHRLVQVVVLAMSHYLMVPLNNNSYFSHVKCVKCYIHLGGYRGAFLSNYLIFLLFFVYLHSREHSFQVPPFVF